MADRRCIIGIGNRYRRDDGLGPLAIDALRALNPTEEADQGVTLIEHSGEALSLINAWASFDSVVIVDAARGPLPGRPIILDPGTQDIPRDSFRGGSHVLGLAEAIHLARELDCLPPRLRIEAVVGEDFSAGEGLSPPVQRELAALITRVRAFFVAIGSLRLLLQPFQGVCCSCRCTASPANNILLK
ncbi:MAG: hydrogenase maturation protease, partial [Magnetovibrionaceae bacterium]